MSPAIGVVLLIAIVLLLALTAGLVFTDLAESGAASAQVHGTGSYDISFDDQNQGYLHIQPQSVQTRDTTFVLRINGVRAHEWNGREPLEISCLMPDDRLQIITEKEDTTQMLLEHRVDNALQCQLGIIERFKYAFVNGNRVEVGTEYEFDLAIDPDGPGTDRTYGNDVDKQNVGPIPLTSDWHYRQQYAGPIEGMGAGDAPVYVYVMADNVHWNNAPSWAGGLNWTDPVPSGRDPGHGTYQINGNSLDPTPSQGAGEPTNDIYMLFEPGCDGSRVLIVHERAGYDNQILMDGQVVVDNTNDDSGIVLDAPPIPCYEG